MLFSASISILALSLPSIINGRALSKKIVKWSQCPDLNKNISGMTATFENFECGTISVPLDYTDDESPPLELHLFKVEATKEPVLGTVLFNPGGPGGSAAENLPPSASDLRVTIGDQYHIVSWDPRGTGYTIPWNCTGTPDDVALQPAKRDVERLSSPNLIGYFSTYGWEAAGQQAEVCAASKNETGSLIGTAFTARDMLAIVDALCEDGLLRYYGLSYGSVLGSYFATMFPDRVERMVLDANLDPADYRDGTWGDSLLDAGKTFNAFLDACFDNNEECALATFIDANSTQDIFSAVDMLLEQLTAAIDANITDEASIIDYVALKALILDGLYFPSTWPALAETITLTLNDTTSGSAADSTAGSELEGSGETSWTYGKAVDAITGIRSSDTTFQVESAEEYLPEVEYQANLSSFSNAWYFRSWTSARWKLPAKERLYGDFKATTKHPILYVNGEYDPVTPLAAARRASKGFEGSVVLAHNGKGHGALADPSTCVQNHIQAYFKNGVLPEQDVHCEPDLDPWALAKARNGRALGAIR